MGTEMVDLVRYLDGQRRTVLSVLEGLTDMEATARTPVSEMPLLGIVQHLGFVERRWIHMGADGQILQGCYPPDPAKEFGVAGVSVAEVTASYDAIARESDRILLSFDSGDDVCRSQQGSSTAVRQIALHLIEETAAHAGHAALIRESIDGRVGD